MMQRSYPRSVAGLVALAWSFATPTVVFAHSVNERVGDFYGGMLHPVTALEHLLPILALGMLAGQQSVQIARWVLFVFPLALMAGCASAMFLEEITIIAWFNVASFVIVGVMVAAALPIPSWLLVALTALMGLSHGYENGVELPRETSGVLYVAGVGTVGMIVVALTSAVTVSLRVPWQQIAVRVLGSWIAAIGLMVLAVK